MQGKAKLIGLEDAMRALEAAFPNNPKKQAQIVNGAMGGSARKSFLPIAKQLAKRGDSSGALSEAMAVRAMPARKRRARGSTGGMEVTPVRYNPRAIAKYIRHYYTSRGRNPPLGGIDGIRHGHLIEFGTSHSAAYPFLWPSTTATPQYRALFAGELKKRIEANVRRAAKKRAKK